MRHPMAIAAMAACLVSLASLGANLPDWSKALEPGFVFPALGAIGSTLLGIYSPRPIK